MTVPARASPPDPRPEKGTFYFSFSEREKQNVPFAFPPACTYNGLGGHETIVFCRMEKKLWTTMQRWK